jgi:hypothetical protein
LCSRGSVEQFKPPDWLKECALPCPACSEKKPEKEKRLMVPVNKCWFMDTKSETFKEIRYRKELIQNLKTFRTTSFRMGKDTGSINKIRQSCIVLGILNREIIYKGTDCEKAKQAVEKALGINDYNKIDKS